jgi:nitroimidazol reductase NimA-like FMN-containing flavoprotein (pyridoxamine 5'-phosphate oxidase superfamily)
VRTEDEWASVLAFGPVEEVHDDKDRLRAMDALMRNPMPPAWGASEHQEPLHHDRPGRVYMLKIQRMTGRRSVPAGPSRAERELALGGM